jgi:hypothetical protein
VNGRADRMAAVDAGPTVEDINAPEFRAEPSKISVRLAPRLYYGLLEFCADAARHRGKRVTNVDVFRALVTLLLDDGEVRDRVIGELRKKEEV